MNSEADLHQEALIIRHRRPRLRSHPAARHGDYFNKKQAKEYGEKQDKLSKKAEENEKDRDDLLKESAHHEERHKWLTGSATLFEIGIAMSTVAIITRRHWLWLTARSAFGGVGLGLLGFTYAAV